MKNLFLAFSLLSLLGLLSSCETTHQRKAGGSAFSDSELARKLDANIPLEDPSAPGRRSFEEWRSVNE